MADIFICYAKEDSRTALKIASCLEEKGYTVWAFSRDAKPGKSYLEQALKAVDTCKVAIIIISDFSIKSYQVECEVEHAHECKKSFIPILKGITHPEFKEKRPSWLLAVSTKISITIPKRGVSKIIGEIVDGLQLHGVPLNVEAEDAHKREGTIDTEIKISQKKHRKIVTIIIASAILVILLLFVGFVILLNLGVWQQPPTQNDNAPSNSASPQNPNAANPKELPYKDRDEQ